MGHQVRPDRGPTYHPNGLFCFRAPGNLIRHRGGKVLLKSWVRPEYCSDPLLPFRTELIERNLGRHLVTDCVPGMCRRHGD
jgi:hypothetical protein